MKRHTIFGATAVIAMTLVLVSTPVNAATIWTESFDDALGFTTSEAFFSDGSGDFFGLYGVASDFGAGASPSAVKAYTAFDVVTGNILTGMDLDGEGATLPITLTWTGINITGLTGLQFSGDFAEFFDDPGDIDDADDMILIEYQIDGGGYQGLLAFEGGAFSNDPYNGYFMQDTDFDGVGDGTALGDAAQTFSQLIPGTGSTLDIRLTVSVNSGDEDFAVDNFIVVDAVPVELQSFSIE